ncbi:MAG: transcriptional regulator, Crp/Fnr family [Gammaproteobacteria bacterium]|nr:transcriptional regulator, Crp/Fnr family [Gammaproteobacteria bacterium]
MAGTPHPQQNHILDALPQTERERLFPYLTLVALPLGKALYESGDMLRHIYFPTDAIVSLLYVLKDGASQRRARAQVSFKWLAPGERCVRTSRCSCRAPARLRCLAA